MTEAEDLAQETLLKAFGALDQFVPGTNMPAWLARILRNTRIDRLRSAQGSAGNVSLDALALDVADEPDETEQWDNPAEVLNAFGDEEIIEALKALPEEIRWTLLLVDVQGLALQEAATVLEIPVGTVKSRVFRGRRMLKEALLPVAKRLRLI